jgi:signal peptidase II
VKFGLGLATLVALADQASKHWILGLRDDGRLPLEVMPVFNLVFTWNRGITFGLFNVRGEQGLDIGRWLLVALTLVILIGLLVWLARARDRLIVTALGLVVGGAVGNLVDRARFGAVADFLDFHWGEWHWYVFNIADSAIVCGVGLLLLDSLLARRKLAK